MSRDFGADLRASVIHLHDTGTGRGTEIIEQLPFSDHAEADDIRAVKARHAVGVGHARLDGDDAILLGEFGQCQLGRLAPGLGLVTDGKFVHELARGRLGDGTQTVRAVLEDDIPAQPCGRKVLTVTLVDAEALAIGEELDFGTIGIDADFLRLAGLAPAHRPLMAEQSHHGLLRPIALEDVIAFLRGAIALDDALLIHAGHGILRPKRGGEILEDPLGATGQPRHLLLLLEVPVEEIDHVALGPVAVF